MLSLLPNPVQYMFRQYDEIFFFKLNCNKCFGLYGLNMVHKTSLVSEQGIHFDEIEVFLCKNTLTQICLKLASCFLKWSKKYIKTFP